jgi:hypothetical protein
MHSQNEIYVVEPQFQEEKTHSSLQPINVYRCTCRHHVHMLQILSHWSFVLIITHIQQLQRPHIHICTHAQMCGGYYEEKHTCTHSVFL